jgi:hypothetical protein
VDSCPVMSPNTKYSLIGSAKREKRSAILEAATLVILKQGLSAPTMVIAKEAGIANGSLFTYFETRSRKLSFCYFNTIPYADRSYCLIVR